MSATKYRRAEVRASHLSRALRFVIVKDRRTSRRKAEFYTGIHDSPESLWSVDHRAAVIYAHLILATNDLISLQGGRLPEGRRGVRTENRWYD
jgi:hypothetical protein